MENLFAYALMLDTGFESLKNLELWRIAKLEDLSFVGTLENLETLSLTDLKYIHTLPDLCEEMKTDKKVLRGQQRIDKHKTKNF